jgi:hypothetical protein
MQTQTDPTVLAEVKAIETVLYAVPMKNVDYCVRLEFVLKAMQGTKPIRHEVWCELKRVQDSGHANVIATSFRNAGKDAILLFALMHDFIPVEELFEYENRDPTEGGINWYKRHGIPDDVVIISIGTPKVTVFPMSR